MINRRRSTRYAIVVTAEVTEASSGKKLTGRTSDVSRTGGFVDSLDPLPEGSEVRIVLTRGNERFESLAKVVYSVPRLGMGISFELPGDDQLAILESWFEQTTLSKALT